MNIEKNKPVINPFKIVNRTIMRFYLVLYVTAVAGGLIVSVIILRDILTTPQIKSQTSPTATANDTLLLEQVVTAKLNGLETSQKNEAYKNIQLSNPNLFLK